MHNLYFDPMIILFYYLNILLQTTYLNLGNGAFPRGTATFPIYGKIG